MKNNEEIKYIETGFTNVSYIQNHTFVQEKKYTGFNHKIDYSLLSIFDFVPKLISNNEQKIKWQEIEGEKPDLSEENLIQIAKNIKQIHNSNIKFPASNHAARVKKYRQILKEKNIEIKALNDFYRIINKVLANMDKTTPLHNDLWTSNMIKDNKTGKIYFVDWEYATLGDRNFELAYFIESQNLDEKQIEIFLNAYDSYIDEKILTLHRILVNSLVVMWANAQDILPFDTAIYEKRMYELQAKIS
ncbi:phosphotransferase family protein [Mycoplasmopsis hyopharyngis]|uniref:phosphotransferase family protein n=1 Tax=Mycoplasmopsis hyopharyngis TaxID=29558 RepID=UPI003872AED7